MRTRFFAFIMIFMNNNNSIIIKCDPEKDNLPKHHLITTIYLDNMYYGFYLNKIDIEKSKCVLYIGKCITFPENYKQQFNLLQHVKKCPSIKENKIVNVSKISNTPRSIFIKNYFKTYEDIFKTCCIFHVDKNPSMSVNLKLGVFHCFSCKEGGSITKLINKIHK